MDKPTRQEVETFIKEYGVNDFRFTESIEMFTVKFYGRFKDSDAKGFSSQVNNKFGQWIYSSVNYDWRDYTSVSINYRSKELSKCPYCGCLDGMHNYCPVVIKCKTCQETRINCTCGEVNKIYFGK
jgi:hypothetical protein